VTLLGDQLLRERAALLDSEDRSRQSIAEEREILAAILAKEPSLARGALIHHLDRVDASVAQLVSEREGESS
jgi:DNA-binding GntR family transcriptional regulator